MERIIYRCTTEDYPIEVSDDGSERILRFGTEERQSCLDLDHPHELQLAYTRWMMTALAIHPSPKRFLLCGLGGGSMVHFLHHHHPEASLDIVEKDAHVISIAQKYFNLPRNNNLRIYHRDVIDFLCTPHRDKPYHIAFIDIFGAGTMATPLFSVDFYRAILQRLAADGIMAVNLWNGNKELFTMAADAIRESCNNQVLQMPVKKRSNSILLAFPEEIPKKTIRKARKQAALHRQRYQLPFQRYLKRMRRTNKPGLLALFP